MSESTEKGVLATIEAAQQPQPSDVVVMPGFGNDASWGLANRIAKAFAASTLVPAHYQGNVANCIVALEMANRMRASPLMVMQNLYLVHGNPGWSAKFLIACFNECGRFESIRYDFSAARTECRAYAIEKATGERIEGPLVSLAMAQAEGWATKNGSKWKTRPELMLMYRAAAFLVRTYAPEISMGLRTDDELVDMGPPASSSTGAMSALAAVESVLPSAPEQEATPPADKSATLVAQLTTAIINASSKDIATSLMEQAYSKLPVNLTDSMRKTFESAWGPK